MTFSVAHFLLADKYRIISKRMPTQLEGKEEKPDSTCDKVTYWTLFAMNILSGATQGGLVVVFRTTTLINKETPSIWLKRCNSAAFDWVGIC